MTLETMDLQRTAIETLVYDMTKKGHGKVALDAVRRGRREAKASKAEGTKHVVSS